MAQKLKVQDLDDKEIAHQLGEMDEQLFRLKFQMSMGQMEGLKKARSMRKDRARMLTVLRERALAAQAGGKK
jgi:large subunit ribosomal protein L29